jgi:tetratricopeptide (TPR) repeat protein
MFDKITDLFRSGSSVPDFIVGVGLEEWYVNFSDEQQQKLHEYSTLFGTGGEMNLLDKGTGETSQSAQEYLKGVGSTAASEKDYEFAEMVLLEALDHEDGSATSTHFTYNELIDVYYKQRDDREDAIKKCIQYCKKDIEIADEFVAEFGEVPRIPSFKRLAIIYEKQERYADAIAVCEQALEIGTTDGTKGGFEGRKDRLRKKLNDK